MVPQLRSEVILNVQDQAFGTGASSDPRRQTQFTTRHTGDFALYYRFYHRLQQFFTGRRIEQFIQFECEFERKFIQQHVAHA
jgi:hypothetical protein